VHRGLLDPNCYLSIGALAMRWGFSDQAQFTRSFRQHFACTASEVRASARHGRDPGARLIQ
jgi:AraC-like DNA-binding protein